MSQSSLLLAIECVTRTASVAIARGEQILVVRSARSDRHHAESLLAVASLGRVALAAGGAVDAAELVPRYLRRPEAEERRLAAAPSLDTGQKLE